MPEALVLPVLLLTLELAKRIWHQTRDERAVAAHAGAIVALFLTSPAGSLLTRVGLALSIGGWLLSRLTIDEPFWRRRRWGRWDLWHAAGAAPSSWAIELAVLWDRWPLWPWRSVGEIPLPALPWDWAWAHVALWALIGALGLQAWIWRRPAHWGDSFWLRWRRN